MSKQSPPTPIRLSLNQTRSNPVLASDRAYKRGQGRRNQEQRQLDRLKALQSDGIVLHHIPKMIRVDSSSLETSSERIGVVGLVVDNQGEGYVTQLRVKPNPIWDISVDLPFRQIHIQSLLFRVLDGPGLDDSLPELFAYKVTDSLADRCEGDSMDIACLLAIFDASVKHENQLLHAAAAVVSPTEDSSLEASKSVTAKLNAFVREFGHGSLLVRHADDEQASAFDVNFDAVWSVRNLSELATQLSDVGLTHAMLEKVALKSEHGFAIASQMQRLLADESQFPKAEDFLKRLNRRASDETPVKIRLEISLAEEDLHRHRGNFDAAIATREQRLAMMASPLITCYEREADSDNRHAAALYDAHRFSAAIDCLTPWYEKLQVDPKICLPETRAKLFNTLARCFVASKDPNWESLFRDSLEIQFVSDPGNVPITENYLSHGLLAFNRFNEAKSILKFGSDESDPFRIWLAAECSRQAGEVWDESLCQKALSISESFHVHGFACQAIARQPGRTPDSKTRYFESARRSFEHGMEADVTNVKRMLGAYCSFAIAAVADDQSELSYAVRQFRRCTAGEGFKEIREWYMDELDSIERNRNWASIETLFQRVPHL